MTLSQALQVNQEQQSARHQCNADSLCRKVEQCLLPTLNPVTLAEAPQSFTGSALRALPTAPHVNIVDAISTLESSTLRSFCDLHKLSLETLVASAWALVLREYTAGEAATFGEVLTPFNVFPSKSTDRQTLPGLRIWHCSLDGASRVKDFLAGVNARHSPCSTNCRLHNFYNTAICLQPPADVKRVAAHEYLHDKIGIVLGLDLAAKYVTTSATHDSSHFTPSYASNLATTLNQALIEVIYGLDKTLDELKLSDEKTWESIRSWTPECPKASRTYVPDAISQNAMRTPDASAICTWESELSYQALEESSNRLAHYLQSLGIGPESRVLTCFDKSAWAIVSLLAILKAGAAFTPLDIGYPMARIMDIAAQTQAQLILASKVLLHHLRSLPIKTLVVDFEFLNSLPLQPTAPSRLVGPRNLAYILFTSGSTGRPKGVMIEHEALSSSIEAHGKALGITSDSRALQFTSYTFDPSITEIFATLLYGGCVCVPEQNARVTDLGRCINDLKVNWAFFTPSVIALIQPSEVPGLKTVVVGGEAVTQDCVDTWASKVELFNAYGPTECCIFCLVTPIHPGSQSTNIGYGVGSRPWIVSPRDHNIISPIGSIGELLIEGRTLSRGYLNDPEKTESAFCAEPDWAANLAAINRPRRLYRTGDLARYNADGSITCLGRKDRQVKIRGQRIEPGEIETRIKQHLGNVISQVVVDVSLRGMQKTSQVLTAFLAFDRTELQNICIFKRIGSPVPAITDSYRHLIGRLEAFLLESLPINMVPAVFVPLTALPRTISGKVDRTQLQMIYDQFSAEHNSTVSKELTEKMTVSWTRIEYILRKEWSKLLDIPESSIDRNDRFFVLGGNSILAIKLASVARRLGLRLNVADIFHSSSLLDMASKVEDIESQKVSTPEPFSMVHYGGQEKPLNLIDVVAEQCQVHAKSIQDIYPCTPAQESLMAASVAQPGSYTGNFTFKLSKSVNLHRFRAAWSEANRQLNILRTRIVEIPSMGYLQAVVDEDIEWLYTTEWAEFYLVNSKKAVAYGGKLTGYALVEQDDCTWFVWAIHHSLFDAWCSPKYLEIVSKIYLGNQQPSNTVIPFQNFIHYLQSSYDEHESSAFWRSMFEDVSSPQFPRLPSPTYEPQIDDSVAVKATVSETKIRHITTAMLAQAAWALVIAQHTGSADVIFGSVVTGRNAPVTGIDSIVGPTIATVPIRITVEYRGTIGSFLDLLLERATAMIHREQDGLQRIKQASEAARIACNFQTIFVVQSNQGCKYVGDEQLFQLVDHPAEVINSQSLALECIIEKDHLSMEARFDSKVISSTLMQRILNQWRHVVHQLSGAYPGQSIDTLSFISPEDIEDLKLWNSVIPPPMPGFVHEQISMWAKLQPLATAICSWEGEVTYEELEDTSSRLASLLIACGVGRESIVPVYFDKGIPVVVSMMAVLKAGAAFVPLDCTAPDTRIKDILKQIDASVVLASKESSNLWPSHLRSIFVNWEMLLALPERKGPLAIGLRSNNLAYMIMTSGSTGKPKGVMIEHGSLSTSVEHHGRYYGLGRQSRVLQFASLAFDAAVGDIVATIVHGGCLVMPHKDTRMDNLTGYINEARVNWSFFTPSTLKTFQPSDVPTIETIVVGGEAITDECIETWASEVHLINGYGPSETTIACAAASMSSDGSNRGSIGRGLGCLTWIVAADNHDRLSPIGAVGELMIQGPIVGRGYLGNEDQTLAAFVENPSWLNTGTQHHVRLYKTGDLVHYNDDGTLQYVGRKDFQVKIRGQRVELGEIESCVCMDEAVEHAAVTFPVSGGSKEHLVTFLELKCQRSRPLSYLRDAHVQPLNRSDTAAVVDRIRNDISEQLLSYMIPDYWVVIDTMPITTSGKIDRKVLTHWIEGLTYTECQIYRPSNVDEEVGAFPQPSTREEKILQNIWADVLNVPPVQIGVNRSFLTMGGDSLMAMQALRRCRTEGFKFNVRQLLQGQTIAHLARNLESAKALPGIQHETIEQPFKLSPIQQMYAAAAPRSGSHHFNQSRRLRLARKLDYGSLYHSMGAVVCRHSMLRARFFSSADGSLAQYVSKDTESSYSVRVHSITSPHKMNEIMTQSQKSLNVKEGPTITADVFNSDLTDQSTLFLVAHHLVVDNVSWNIILDDLESVLRDGQISGPPPLPFQTWCNLQAQYIRHEVRLREPNLQSLPPTNLEYWGLQRSEITYGTAAREKFVFGHAQSRMLLGNYHETLHTEFMDLIVAATLTSFQRIFRDRGPPALFTEAHGRESFRPDADPSNTVGWFTTLCPCLVPIETGESLISTLKRVKDMRRRIRSNGWEYFSSRFLHPEGRGNFEDNDFPEVVINNTGMNEAFGSLKSLLSPDPESVGDVEDMSPNMPRFALMDITAGRRDGLLEFEWLFSPNMRHAERVVQWIRACMKDLEHMALSLCTMSPEYTLADFPLMSMTDKELDRIVTKKLPELGFHVPEEIETFYPASPIQEAILNAQATSPRYFSARLAFEVKPNGTRMLDVNRLCRAWQLVVHHYAILRTVLLPYPSDEGSFVQVVVRTYEDATKVIDVTSPLVDSPLRLPRAIWKPNEPHHRMTICRDKNRQVFCCWDVSHALIDHASMSLLFDSLSHCYDSEQLTTATAPYTDLISHIQSTPKDISLDYWKTYMRNSPPCRLAMKPATTTTSIGELESTKVDLVPLANRLKSVSRRSNVTMANIFRLTWALLLCRYLRTDDVTFGYLVSGRDTQIPNVDRIVGPLMNVLACRFKDPSRSIASMLNALQDDFLTSLPHQHHLVTLLQSSQTGVAPGNDGHFDTLVNFRRHVEKETLHTDRISFEPIQSEDPFNYAVVVEIDHMADDEVKAVLTFWAGLVSKTLATNLSKNYTELIETVLAGLESQI